MSQISSICISFSFRRVWVFADPPHGFKLLRNHLLDDGITLPDGGILDREFFTQVLAIDNGEEFRILPKLGIQSHLEVM